MSIYATTFILEDAPDVALGAPWVYQGSHVLPNRNDERGGQVSLALIPRHVTRPGRRRRLPDWLRLNVNDETVVLDACQARALMEVIHDWLADRG